MSPSNPSNRPAATAAMRRTAMLWCAMLAIALLAACASDAERGSFKSVGAHGWEYLDTVALMPDTAAADSAAPICNIAVDVRHTAGYAFSNIWLELTYTPSGCDTRRDTFDMRLADPVGRWLGKGLGVGHQKVDTLVRGVALDPRMPVTLRHVMRADTLAGIEQAGIIIIRQ